MMNLLKVLSVGLIGLSLIGCNCEPKNEVAVATETKEIVEKVVLPSWNDVTSKKNIVAYVTDVINPESPNFIEIKDRIATFDNEGNLWAEQPVYFQLYFAMDRIKAMAAEHPEWKTEQPYQAILEDDMQALLAQGEEGLIKMLMTSHTGTTQAEFKQEVKKLGKYS